MPVANDISKSLPRRIVLLIDQKLLDYYRLLTSPARPGDRAAFEKSVGRKDFLAKLGPQGRRYLKSGMDDVAACVAASGRKRTGTTGKRARLCA